MSHPTTIRLDDDEFRRLRRLAEERETSVSELVRRAIRAAYFEEDRDESVDALMAFIRDNPEPVEGDVEDVESTIERAMGDAAGR